MACKRPLLAVFSLLVVAVLFSSRAYAAPFAYAVNGAASQPGGVSVIDTATDTVVATIPTGTEVARVALTPDGTKAFVTNYQSRTVSIIDTATISLSATVSLSDRPIGVAITSDGKTAYVVGTDGNQLFAVDVATNVVSGPFPSGGTDPRADSNFIAIAPDGRAYIPNRFTHTVSVFDTSTNQLLDLIPVESPPEDPDPIAHPYRVAINPGGTKVYVGKCGGCAAQSGPTVLWVIDPTTNSVAKTIVIDDPLANTVVGIAFTSDGARAYVALSPYSQRVAIIDAIQDVVLGETEPVTDVPCGGTPGCLGDIAITPDNTKAYVALGDFAGGNGAIAVLPLIPAAPPNATIPVRPGLSGNVAMSRTTLIPTSTPTPLPAPTCGGMPVAGCRTPAVAAASLIQLKDRAPDSRDLLVWKWSKGSATAKSDFGNPASTTSYRLCVYDASGGAQPLLDAEAPGGGVCGDKACWTDKSYGFLYNSRDLTPDGSLKLKLQQGSQSKAKILLNGKGTALAMPSPLSVMQPLIAQLMSSGGVCWEATYSAPPTRNDATQFKDRAD
jgi:YVTN family beta-propeller protein